MSDVVPGHGADLALIEKVVDVRPVDRAGLRLDHPEILSLETARQIMGGAVASGLEMALADIVVPRRHIEILRDGVVIEAIEPTHHVGGDELAGVGVGANHVELIALVASPRIADETHPAQQEAGISVTGLDRNLIPRGVGLAPVGCRPARVEVVESAVTRLDPLLELSLRGRVEGDFVVLVVDLPAEHVWIVAESFGELFGNLARHFTIFRDLPS